MDTENSESDADTKPNSRSKVAALLHQYDLTGIGTELETLWTADDESRLSLRELAAYFNKRLLAFKLEANAASVVDGEVANYYRLLTDDAVSSGKRVAAENTLRRQGVDVETLRNEFVSRQAIHTFLTTERNTTYEPPNRSEQDRIEGYLESIGRIRSRLASIAEQSLSQLAQSNPNFGGVQEVTVLVQVQCDHCGTQSSITEFLSNNGCDCNGSTE